MESNPNHRKRKIHVQFPVVVASPSAPPPSPPWIDLPGEITANILQRLDAMEILESAQKVCTTWRRVSLDPSMWRVIHLKKPGDTGDRILTMCRLAVKRSQGQLIDLSINYIGDDELLNFIVDRSSGLRCLALKCCRRISGKGLIKAVEKLEHLEELHLVKMGSFDAGNVETIGVSCPMLKSFTCNECFSRNNDFALAIAKTMPNLIHLRLVANAMKNEALEAILDSCSHLELLDLRRCVGLDLQGDLAKRCSEQIKDLRLPSDVRSEYDPSYESYYESGSEYESRTEYGSWFTDDDDDDV